MIVIKAFQATKAEERAFQKFVEETWYPQEADMETLPPVPDDEPGPETPATSDRTAPVRRVGTKALDTDPDPSPKRSAARLRNYWVRGAGAAKIRWGQDGDFLRCVGQLGKYVEDPKGLCNVYHRSALGAPPGQGHKEDSVNIEEKSLFDLNDTEFKRVLAEQERQRSE